MKWLEYSRSVYLKILLVIALAVANPLPANQVPENDDSSLLAQFKEISAALVCQCGCNSVLLHCAMQNCHFASPAREEIRRKLQNGESKDAIIAGFAERYGLRVLAAPPASGFHLTAWIMPFIALVVGALLTKRVLSSWRRQTAVARVQNPLPVEISAEQKARIEREIQDLET